jgi:hypothetical protein
MHACMHGHIDGLVCFDGGGIELRMCLLAYQRNWVPNDDTVIHAIRFHALFPIPHTHKHTGE